MQSGKCLCLVSSVLIISPMPRELICLPINSNIPPPKLMTTARIKIHCKCFCDIVNIDAKQTEVIYDSTFYYCSAINHRKNLKILRKNLSRLWYVTSNNIYGSTRYTFHTCSRSNPSAVLNTWLFFYFSFVALSFPSGLSLVESLETISSFAFKKTPTWLYCTSNFAV